MPDMARLQQMTARFAPTEIAADVSKLSDGDRRVLAKLIEAGGGLDRFLAEHAVILLADHAQTPVDRGLPLADLLAREWAVLRPSD